MALSLRIVLLALIVGATAIQKPISGGAFPAAGRMRQEEIEYALKSLRVAPWADERDFFLMGHSEGGGVVALWQGGGFKAQIISGNRCRQGLAAPSTIPVIVIGFVHDPWDGNYRRTCAIRFGAAGKARRSYYCPVPATTLLNPVKHSAQCWTFCGRIRVHNEP